MAAATLTACAPDSPALPTDSTIGVAPGDYAIMFTNMGVGEDPGRCRGMVSLFSRRGDQKADVGFRPVENDRMISHAGAVAWLAGDAVHHWAARHRRWDDLPFNDGAVDVLLPAGDRVLAVINGMATTDGYRSALALFNESGSHAWEVNGSLGDGVGWFNEAALGFSLPSLDAPSIRLTRLGPDSDRTSFGPGIKQSTLWGGQLVPRGDHILVLHAPATRGPVGQIWKINPATATWDRIPLTGSGADVTNWYAGSGPEQICIIGEKLYWLANKTLWKADPATGATHDIAQLPQNFQWFLQPEYLLGLRHETTNSSKTRHVERRDPTTANVVEGLTLTIASHSRGLISSNAVWVPSGSAQ